MALLNEPSAPVGVEAALPHSFFTVGIVSALWLCGKADCGAAYSARETLVLFAGAKFRITALEKFSISSRWGLNSGRRRSTPTFSKAAMRSRTCVGVPTRPERRPRLETE